MTNLQKIVKYAAIALAFTIIIASAVALLSGIDFLFSLVDNNAKKLTNGKAIEINKNITKIEIELKSTNLIIERDKNISAATNNDNISARIRGNTLIITERNTKIFNNEPETDLVIYIPDDHILEELSLDSGAGKIEFFDITVKELELNLGAGTVEIDSVNVLKETAIDGGAGKLTINNSNLNNLELDMGVGSLELTSTLIGDNEISCGVGDVDINLIGDDYKIEVDKGLGATTIAGQKIKDGEIFGTGKNLLEIDGGVGSITINFIIEDPITIQ